MASTVFSLRGKGTNYTLDDLVENFKGLRFLVNHSDSEEENSGDDDSDDEDGYYDSDDEDFDEYSSDDDEEDGAGDFSFDDEQMTTAIEEAEATLQALKTEIETMEEQVEYLGRKLPNSSVSFKEKLRSLEDPKVTARGEENCGMLFKMLKKAALQSAIETGERYKSHLKDRLGPLEGCKSTLEIEKEKTREAAERDNPFGRTGTYRGHGTGALKPARHLNSNKGSQPSTQAQSSKLSAQVAKPSAPSSKKAKKPKLVW